MPDRHNPVSCATPCSASRGTQRPVVKQATQQRTQSSAVWSSYPYRSMWVLMPVRCSILQSNLLIDSGAYLPVPLLTVQASTLHETCIV